MKKLLLILAFFALNLQAQTQEPDLLFNLALSADAKVTGSVTSGRGLPTDILYNPATANFATSSRHSEYGVNFGQNLGLVKEEDPFFWRVDWETPKLINHITFAGTYPNQPQPNTMWKISYLNGSDWVITDKGQGGWIDSGIYEWSSLDLQPITANAVKVELFSDNTNPLISVHLRGRNDTTETKATVIQLLPYTAVNVAQDLIDAIALLKLGINELSEQLILNKVESATNKKKIETLKNRINELHNRD